MKNEIIINEKFLNNNSKIKKAMDYIKSTNFDDINDCKLYIDNNIWANLQTYYTKEDALFEAHKKYIDIQFIISGQEKIVVANYSNCAPKIKYNSENDIEFLTTEKYSTIKMNSGDFLILYPSDAHKPSISIDRDTTLVRKLVVKIPIDNI